MSVSEEVKLDFNSTVTMHSAVLSSSLLSLKTNKENQLTSTLPNLGATKTMQRAIPI